MPPPRRRRRARAGAYVPRPGLPNVDERAERGPAAVVVALELRLGEREVVARGRPDGDPREEEWIVALVQVRRGAHDACPRRVLACVLERVDEGERRRHAVDVVDVAQALAAVVLLQDRAEEMDAAVLRPARVG